MSILRTYNLQSIDSSNSNIQLTENAGAIVSGLTTAQSGLHVTSGNIGIGTNSPDALVHLHKSSTSGFDGILITNSTTGATTSGGFTIGLNDSEEGRIWHYGNESIQFGVDNELHGTLRQDGRWCLGPNQTSGSHVLNVFEAAGPSAQFRSDSDAGISIKDDSDSSVVEITNNNGQLTIDLDNSGQVTTEAFIIEKNGGSSDTAELFRITSVGHVGIGTTAVDSHLTLAAPSATARLELRRTNEAGGGSYGAINFTALDGHSVASIHVKGDGDGDDNGGDIVFRTTSDATSNDPYAITERLRIKSDGVIETVDSTYGASNFRLAGAYAEVRDQKTHDVAGGTFTSGAWRTRALNNIHHDNDNIILNLASNRFRLGPGKYRIEFSTPAYGVNRHQCRLYNATAGSVVEYGEANYSSAAVRNSANTGSTHASQNWVRGSARVTLTANADFEVQQRCQTTNATNGYGVEADFASNVEVYSRAIIYKEV